MTATTSTHAAVANLVHWLETGELRDDLFAADCFTDLTLPHWRVQATTSEEIVAIRESSHPCNGRVRVERVDETASGFVIAFEERWEDGGQQWYCREQIRADVIGDTIVDMAVYCTGDWDEAKQREHAAAVHLARP